MNILMVVVRMIVGHHHPSRARHRHIHHDDCACLLGGPIDIF